MRKTRSVIVFSGTRPSATPGRDAVCATRRATAPRCRRHRYERAEAIVRAQVSRAEPFRDPLRGHVLRRNRVNDPGPAERVERPVRRGDGAFGRVAAPPAVAHDGPADFGARPALGLPGPEAPDPASRLLFEHGEHRKALRVPRTDHGHHPSPAHGAGHGATNIAGRFRVFHHLGPGIEIVRARRTQQQPRRLEAHAIDRARQRHASGH